MFWLCPRGNTLPGPPVLFARPDRARVRVSTGTWVRVWKGPDLIFLAKTRANPVRIVPVPDRTGPWTRAQPLQRLVNRYNGWIKISWIQNRTSFACVNRCDGWLSGLFCAENWFYKSEYRFWVLQRLINRCNGWPYPDRPAPESETGTGLKRAGQDFWKKTRATRPVVPVYPCCPSPCPVVPCPPGPAHLQNTTTIPLLHASAHRFAKRIKILQNV